MGDIEYGKCDICGKEANLNRTYYEYDIKCSCHSPNHFELVCHCNSCVPTEPTETKITIRTDVLKELAKNRTKKLERILNEK